MADVFSKKKRSEIMSRIRSKNTLVEKKVFFYLRKNGVYFQRHYGKIPGKPDIALPRKKRAIFIDGDFWHGRDYGKTRERLPSAYWKEKISQNIARDKRNRKELKNMGWKVLRVWESQLKKQEARTLRRVIRFIKETD